MCDIFYTASEWQEAKDQAMILRSLEEVELLLIRYKRAGKIPREIARDTLEICSRLEHVALGHTWESYYTEEEE